MRTTNFMSRMYHPHATDWAIAIGRSCDGGLISYGIDISQNFRRAADYVVKILKGARR